MTTNMLEMHLRVVFACVQREMTARFHHSFGGYLWALLEPCGYIALACALWVFLVKIPPLGDSIVLFHSVSYMPYYFQKHMERAGEGTIRSNSPLYSFPRVNPFDVLVSRSLLEIVTNFIVMAVIIAGAYISIGERPQLDIPNIVIPLTLAMIFGLGIGMFNAVMFVLFPVWERIWHISQRPMLIFSGALYLPGNLPYGVRQYLMWAPTSNVIDWMRTGFYPGYTAPYISRSYAVITVLCTFFLGMVLVHTFQRKIMQR